MNGSSEREAICRHSEGNNNFIPKNLLLGLVSMSSWVSTPPTLVLGELAVCTAVVTVGWGCYTNNEKSIQSYPSPEFLNSLSFIKKFYPAPRWGEGKFPKDSHEIAAISRHSERQRKNPAYYCNTSKLKGIYMNNSTETVHASMPLGIFASKLVSLLGWKVQPTSNIGGVGTPPYVAKSVLTSKNLAAKHVAFTLAEVLITIGIIGVVAALTLPSVIIKYQKSKQQRNLKKFIQHSLRLLNMQRLIMEMFLLGA